METSAPLSEQAPEEINNPGQELADKEFGLDRQTKAAGNPTDPRGNDVAAGDSSDPRGELRGKEQTAASTEHENQVGRGYRSSALTSKPSNSPRPGLSRRKKVGIGVGGGLIGGGIIAIIMFFLPALRLDGYLSGINQRVFATADNAVSNRVSNLFERYMVSKVISMQRCGNVVTGDCANNYSQMGFAKDLFNSWQDARIENKLFEQYGFELKSYKNPADGKERFKIIDKEGRFGNPGDELTIKDGKLSLGEFRGGPRIFGNEWNKFLENTTRWNQVLQRRSVRKYLTRKHGTKFWCLFACSTKDSIDNAKVSGTTKLKLKLVERTVMPFSQKYALILKCLTTGDSSICDPDNLEKAGIDRSLMTDQDLADLKAIADKPGTTFSQLVLEKLLIRVGLDEGAARTAASGVPVAGQIYLALSAIDILETAKEKLEDGTLSKIATNVASDQYVEYYTSMREADDEMKAGAISSDDVGALVSQFNNGGEPAEQSLVYHAYNSSAPSTSTASIFGSALAASSNSPQQDTTPYLCSDGKPIPAGQLVCSDKTLNKRQFKVEGYFGDLKTVVDVLDVYNDCYSHIRALGFCVPPTARDVVHPALKVVNQAIGFTIGTALNAALDPAILILRHTPVIGGLLNQLTDEAGKLVNHIFTLMFPLPVQPDSPGRDKYDALEAGGEITASEFNQGGYTDDGQPYGLGGQLLTDQQQADATEAYLNQQNYNNYHGSIINRLAGTDNPSSLLSRFAMAMPASWSQIPKGMFGLLTHPLQDMGSMWHPAAYAVTNTATVNAFGVPRFGYAANDSAFTADPSIYTPQYCQQHQQRWESSKTQNSVTGIDEYHTTDPCMLEQVSVEAASSVFTQNDSLDDGTVSSVSAASSSASDQQLAQQILNNVNITYPLDASSSNGSTKQVLQSIASGQAAPVTCQDGSTQGVTTTQVDPYILQFILDLGSQTKIGVNALTDKCHVSGSNHYQGKAVDLQCGVDVTKADAVAVKYSLSRNDESCTNPPPGTAPHWHYSTNGK